jgi:hypothetical protein
MGVLATFDNFVIRDWTVSVFGWTFGVVEIGSDSYVCFGPTSFNTGLSALIVAGIAAASLVAVGVVAWVIQGRGKLG